MGYSNASIVASNAAETDGSAEQYSEPGTCIQISDWDHDPVSVTANKVSIVAPLTRSVIIVETPRKGTVRLEVELGHIAWIPQGRSQTIAIEKGNALLIQAEAGALSNHSASHLGVEQKLGVYQTPIAFLIAEAGQQVCNADDADTANFGLAFATLIATELFHSSGALTSSDSNGAKDLLPWLSQIDSFIMENLDKKIAVSDIADLVGLSVYQFIRKFKDLKGISPYKYVVKKRVLAARQLLVEGDSSIAEIAYTVGFSSQSHLTVAFRQQVGVSPGHYRRAAA